MGDWPQGNFKLRSFECLAPVKGLLTAWGGPYYLDRIGAILREGPAVLRGLTTEVSGTKDSTRPPWVDATGLEVNTSAGV